MQRSKLSSTTSSNEGLSARFEKEGISVQTIYDSVLLLKWKEKWSIQELEATYSALELLTRDNSNVLHFINALYKFDEGLSLLVKGIYANSVVVQKCVLRIWDQVTRIKATEPFSSTISFIDRAALENIRARLFH